MGTDKLVFEGEQWGATGSDTVRMQNTGKQFTRKNYGKNTKKNTKKKGPEEKYGGKKYGKKRTGNFFYICFPYLFSLCKHGCCCCSGIYDSSSSNSSSHTHRGKISTGKKYKKNTVWVRTN
jgi:hypothetical protein